MRPDRRPLAERARGRWQGILPQLGVPEKALTNRHGPCPACGGKDRFRFDDKEGAGSWICSQCGAGDGVKLVMLVNGWDFREAAPRIEALIGSAAPAALKATPTTAPKADRKALNSLWQSATAIAADNAAGRWLVRRLGSAIAVPALRYTPRLRYVEGDSVAFHPGMVAMVTGPDDKPATLHRTYLTAAGEKAPVASPRKLMSSPPKGSAIRLAPPTEVLGVAEGVETALAATALFGVPCWATINATMLEQWRPPAGVRSVVVFGDHDRKFGGQAAAYALAHRLACDGRLGVTVTVSLPPDEGEDWNDVLLKRRIAA